METGWRQFVPMGSVAPHLRAVLVRLLWCGIHPELGVSQIPAGWNHELFPNIIRIRCGSLIGEATAFLERVLADPVGEFCEWVKARRQGNFHLFEKAVVEADLEFLRDFFPLPAQRAGDSPPRSVVSPP
jgi:hypothetical protein